MCASQSGAEGNEAMCECMTGPNASPSRARDRPGRGPASVVCAVEPWCPAPEPARVALLCVVLRAAAQSPRRPLRGACAAPPIGTNGSARANLVDPASSHMLCSRAKPCKSQRTWIQQWVCEWLLTSAVISATECGWRRSAMGAQLDILQNLVANTRPPTSAMVHTWVPGASTLGPRSGCGGGWHPAGTKTSTLTG